MPKVLVAFVRGMASANGWLGKVISGAVLVLIAVLIFESISRYVFNNPTSWSLELSGFIVGTYFILGGGYTLLNDEHVRMDSLYNRWSPKKRAMADLATFSLLALYIVVYLLGGIPNAMRAVRVGERSMTMWGPPLAPIKVILVVGAFILLLQGVALFIRDISIVRGKPIV